MKKNSLVRMVSAAALVGALGIGTVPMAIAQEAGQAYPATTDRDDGPDLGWIGLLGLAGLAGLMRRERPQAHHDATYKTAPTRP